jgi:hypothetical protein
MKHSLKSVSAKPEYLKGPLDFISSKSLNSTSLVAPAFVISKSIELNKPADSSGVNNSSLDLSTMSLFFL